MLALFVEMLYVGEKRGFNKLRENRNMASGSRQVWWNQHILLLFFLSHYKDATDCLPNANQSPGDLSAEGLAQTHNSSWSSVIIKHDSFTKEGKKESFLDKC